MYSAVILGPRLRRSRLQAGLKQRDVARQIGVQQSQISGFENGTSKSLTTAKVEAYARLVGLDLGAVPEAVRQEGPQVAFCSGHECPTQDPVLWNGIIVFKPTFLLTEDTNCRYCGEKLFRTCECGAPAKQGLNCAGCGEPFVDRIMPEQLGEETAAMYVARRKQLNDLLLGISTHVEVATGSEK